MNTQLHSQSHEFCSFCTKSRNECGFLIEKSKVSICDDCVQQFDELLKDPSYGRKTQPFAECSFCSFMQTMPAETFKGTKPSEKGFRLVRRSPEISICDECLGVCAEMVQDHERGA